jgi:hypothetical protein
LSRPKFPARADDDVCGQRQQERPGDARRRSLRLFGKLRTAPKLDVEAPEQNTRRRELDQAVDAERGERQAAGGDASAYSHCRFDTHPRKRQIFQLEGFPDQRRSCAGLIVQIFCPLDRHCFHPKSHETSDLSYRPSGVRIPDQESRTCS